MLQEKTNLNLNLVNALYIPYNSIPFIISETSEKIISYVFENDPIDSIFLSSDLEMHMSSEIFGFYQLTNSYATKLYRAYTNVYTDPLVYGPVLVTGKNKTSISPQVVEYITNICYNQ